MYNQFPKERKVYKLIKWRVAICSAPYKIRFRNCCRGVETKSSLLF